MKEMEETPQQKKKELSGYAKTHATEITNIADFLREDAKSRDIELDVGSSYIAAAIIENATVIRRNAESIIQKMS